MNPLDLRDNSNKLTSPTIPTAQPSNQPFEINHTPPSFVIPKLIIPKQETPKYQGKQIVVPVLIEDLIEQEKIIKEYLELALSLDPEAKTTQEVMNQMAPGVIETIIQEGLEPSKSSFETLMTPRSKSNILDFSSPTASPIILEEGFIKDNPGMEIGVVGINLISRGSSVVALGILLSKISEAIKTKEMFLEQVVNENERKKLLVEIEILTRWLDVNFVSFSDMLKDTLIESTFSFPKVIAAIVTIAQAAETVVATVFEWIGTGIGLVGSTYCLYFKHKDYNLHDDWTQAIADSGKLAGNIYERQREIFDDRLEANLPERNTLLSSLNHELDVAKNASASEQEKVRDKVLKILHDAQIELADETPTLEGLQDVLSDPNNGRDINVMMVKKKEVLSVTLRNALKSLNQKKDEVDKGFLQFALDKAIFFFGYTANLTAMSVVVSSLIYAGVIASSSLISILGYGMLALLCGAMALGGYYLHSKKPNIFKTYINGVQAKLAFWSIPLAIQRFRKNCALLENIHVFGQVQEIGIRILKLNQQLRKGGELEFASKETLEEYRLKLENERKAKVEEWKSLSKKVEGLNESVNGLEKRVKPLQDQINEAGWKDFLFLLYGEKELESDTNIEMVEIGKKSSTSEKSLDDSRILAKHLLSDATMLEDPETKKVLLHMGIDLSDVSDEGHESMLEEVSNRIRAFFAMEAEDTLKMIKNQKLLEEHGLRENIADS